MFKVCLIEVKSYSGSKADEYPLSFIWAGKQFKVKDILDRWYQSDQDSEWAIANYYKVRTTTGMQCLIKHVVEFDVWYLIKIWKD